MDPDDREFVRELLRRHERATEAMIQGLERFIDEVRLELAEARKDHEEFREASRAQTQALFAVLDRLA